MQQDRLNHFLGFFKSMPRKYYLWSIYALAAFVTLNIVSRLLSRTFLIVNPGERGLIMNLGKLQEEVLDEGVHITLPFISVVKIINVRVQKIDVESTARTKDLQRITTKLTLNWKIDPIKVRNVYQEIGTEKDVITKIITPAFDEIIKTSMPSRTLEQVLTEREQIKEEIKERIRKRLAPSGVLVTDVAFVNLSASDQFTKATEDRQVAEQQAISEKIVAEQEIKKAEFEVIKAKKEAEALVSKSRGEAEALVNKAKAEAEAQRLLQQSLTPQLLQKQAIDKWNGQYPTVMGGNNALPLISISPTPSPSRK